ncbi:MAG TPA: hypothetical protein VGZ02_03665 [Candidatus Baltobacteraceae bacterium]|jgi:hypothetical protein|nr:hypothetical protein [Candidatus Baltobacteraceae bacterium]
MYRSAHVRLTLQAAALFLVSTLTACGGGGGGAAGTLPSANSTPPAQPTQIVSQSNGTITLTGTVQQMISGGFRIQAGQGVGYLHIYVNSSTVIVGPAPYVNENVEVVGTGSLTSGNITATSVTQIASTPLPSATPSGLPSSPPTPPSSPAPSGTPIPLPTGIVSASGPISNPGTGIFTINAGANYGSMHVYTNSSTAFANGAPVSGQYALVTGTGKLGYSLTASTVALFSNQPGSASASGTVTQATAYGFLLATANGSVPIALTSNTVIGGAPLATGAAVTVNGIGAANVAIVAVQVVVAAPTPNPSMTPSPTPGPIAMTHVATADYLGGNFGQTHWAAGQWGAAAPYLTWAQTNAADSLTISSFGIKTQDYVDPNRVQPGDPMWGYVSGTESSFAHVCDGTRVMMGSQYVTDPTQTTLAPQFASYVANAAAQGRFNLIFEDNAGALGAYTAYTTFTPGLPCNYTDAAWTAGEESLNQASSLPVMVNGLESPNNGGPGLVLNVIGGSSNTTGGNFEHCYSDGVTPKTTGSLWTMTENTELIVNNENKLFQCMLRNLNDGAASVDARIYAYASFLMTYSPQNDIYWEEFATPSGLHVFPEEQLVALNPKVPEPSDVSALAQTGGTYGREYGACYIAGQFAGPCAVVVNPDNNSAHTFPFPQYQHTLVLSGEGVLDGGTIATNGPPPPASLASGEAAIVFP